MSASSSSWAAIAFMLAAISSGAAPLLAQETTRSGGDFSNGLNIKRVPAGEILVKGAWASASDPTTPLPEGGRVKDGAYANAYFELNYPIPSGWAQKYEGPPPSDSGYFVLAQLAPVHPRDGASLGSVQVTAQDLFFTRSGAASALDLMNYSKEKLDPTYEVERGPEAVAIAGRTFVRFDFGSVVAGLHWHALATEIRCHVVKFVFMSRDAQLAETLIAQMEALRLPLESGAVAGKGGGAAPVCVKDYASEENVLERKDPYFAERRFNPVPVRIIIDKEGKVKHIHFLSAFPDQAKAIQDALEQWRFRPYLLDGKAMEVETGILFGPARRPAKRVSTDASAVND